MTIPFLALTLIIGLVPVLGTVSTLQAVGALLGILAVASVAAAFTMPAVKLGRFSRLMQPAVIAALAAPALSMTIQLVPMPALNNQIWPSAALALNQPLAGAITIDIGATLLSLAQYCMAAVAMLVAAAVAIDEKRATNLLYVLTAASAAIAAGLIAIEFGLSDLGQADAEEPAVIAVLGMLLSGTAVLRLYDQLPRSSKPRRAGTPQISGLVAACIAFLICTAAVLTRGEAGVIVAALLGITMLGAAFVIRRWLLGAWGKAGLATAIVVVLLGAIAIIPIRQNADLTVAWSMHDQIATERILADVPLAGLGAGAYEAMLPIYRDVGSNDRAPPTAAAMITIGLGRPFLGALILTALSGAWLLFRRAMTRQRDYVFASAGAAMLAAVPLLLFVNGGILGLGASLLTGIAVGMALGQSLSSRDVFDMPLQVMPPQAKQTAGTCSTMWPRGSFAFLGLVLMAQAVWILGAAGYEAGRPGLLQEAAAPGATDDDIHKAASFAVVRGDLWAKSARAQITGREAETVSRSDSGSVLARKDLERALRYAPHRSDAWLMLALLSERDKLAGYDTGTLLKMSYYTAPNDVALLPLRLDVALRAGTKVPDSELQDMIRRDIGLAVTRQPELRPALAAAYRSASPPQKSIAERLIAEVDPDYLKSILSPSPSDHMTRSPITIDRHVQNTRPTE